MAKNDFDTQALLQFIGGSVGKTLADIAHEFDVSIRTVQRRFRELRTRYCGLEIRESQIGGVTSFRHVRRGITAHIGITRRDIVTLHRLKMAEMVFRASGLLDHADALSSHVESLMITMPRATRQSCEREMLRLARTERISIRSNKPVAEKGVADALQLASVAQRTVSAQLVGGAVLVGRVEAVSYSLDGTAEMHLRLQNGTSSSVELNEITRVNGIDDLVADALA